MAFNQGTPITVTPGNDITASFQVPVSQLSTGFHNLYVRSFVNPYTAQVGTNTEARGGWSLTSVHNFYKEQINVGPGLANIVRGEYFFNSDPGNGIGIPINVSPGTDLNNISFTADVTGLPNGFNNLYVRFQDANGVWSLTSVHNFYKETISTQNQLSKVVRGEYFIGNDPGFGNGKPIPVSPGTDLVNIAFLADVTSAAPGFNNISARFQNQDNVWSLTGTHSFYKEQIQVTDTNVAITKIEYFLDADSGFGKGVNVPFTIGKNVTVKFLVDLTGQPIGNHRLYVRAQNANGKWSLVSNSFINVCTPATLSATHINQSACNRNDGSINLTVTGGTGPFKYKWSTGDTTKNISNLAPGDYTVTVTDAQPCPAMLTVTILPATIITLNTVAVNTTCGNTNGSINASISNGGKAPYTYLWNTGATTSAITSLTGGNYTLTVTDSNGCKASKSVDIAGSVGVSNPVLTVAQPQDPCTSTGTTISHHRLIVISGIRVRLHQLLMLRIQEPIASPSQRTDARPLIQSL